MRRELIDSVNVIVSFIVRTREEANSAFNQSELITIDVQFGRIQNGICKVVYESVVRIMSLGAVDNDGLEILVPALRVAEELAQSLFAVNGVKSEAVDEFLGNVFVNVIGISMAEIILKSSPDVIADKIFKFFHERRPPEIKIALSREAQGELTFKQRIFEHVDNRDKEIYRTWI